ncbi:hypothetical protein [uncultured Aquimarina sp.]|uniref:hypothetical protein n=1 Tax=uncultured Aquimarina sp. TaxID=575652 RepID=UPI002619959B|nr:hypothetical protein [uncultured Aquimarina sp.]
MQKVLTFLILILAFGSCKERGVSSEEDFVKKVKSLNTIDLQKEFLEEIYKTDQETRNALNDARLTYGYDSAEKKEVQQIMVNNDRNNFQKIELYLQKYGHPSIAEHGEKASRAPWIVIHHTGDITSKERNFTYLYEAYRKGNLESGSFSLYLERLHRTKFGNRFTLPNPYREEQLIDSLITRLNLVVKEY